MSCNVYNIDYNIYNIELPLELIVKILWCEDEFKRLVTFLCKDLYRLTNKLFNNELFSEVTQEEYKELYDDGDVISFVYNNDKDITYDTYNRKGDSFSLILKNDPNSSIFRISGFNQLYYDQNLIKHYTHIFTFLTI